LKDSSSLQQFGAFIGDDERIIAIEDTAEVQINKPNLVRLEARREQPGLGRFNPGCLKGQPSTATRSDRVGEVRGGEAFDLLQALNTGHSESLSTIHANFAVEAPRNSLLVF